MFFVLTFGYGPGLFFLDAFTSNYHSLQAQLQKRFSGNSMVNVSYTWSHGLTTDPADRSTGGAALPQVTGDLRGNYGPTIADRRHVLTANFVYDLPFYRTQRGLVGHLAGGWELSGVQTFQTGLPLTAVLGNGTCFGTELPATTRLAQAACSVPRLWVAVPIRSATPTPTLQTPTRVGSMRPRLPRRLARKPRKQASVLAPSAARDFGAPTSPFSRT